MAFGPGSDMFESTQIIGTKQYVKAKELFDSTGEPVGGPINYVYENINMTDRRVQLDENTTVSTCAAALGFSFAAGTTDGEGVSFVSSPTTTNNFEYSWILFQFKFKQGTKSGQEPAIWNILRNFVTNPSKKMLDCQKPKAVLVPIGEMKYPYAWSPEIMPTQLLQVGNIVIVALPAEFTTMAGRRIREDIQQIFDSKEEKVHVILAGLANTYSNYVTTFEEYQVQRYEGGSTLFGPYTLDVIVRFP